MKETTEQEIAKLISEAAQRQNDPPEATSYMMTRAIQRVLGVISVLSFAHKYWDNLDSPDKILQYATEELRNIATPGVAWEVVAEHVNGLSIPPKKNNDS